MQSEDTPPAWPRWALVTLLVWLAACLLMGSRPLIDAVPIGLDADNLPTSQDVECHSALSPSNAPAEPLPELEPPHEYEYTPCKSMHSENRKMLWFDVLLGLAGSAALVRKMRSDRRKAAAAPQEPAPAA